MSFPVTLASIRNQALQRADLVNSAFVTTAEVNQYINNSYAELFDLLTSFPDGDWNLQNFYFRTGWQNQQFGTGTNAGAVTFSGVLPAFPVNPGSVNIYANGFLGQDNGSGVITGTFNGSAVSGTITYSTGAISVTFTAPPPPGTCISASYLGSWNTTDTYQLPSNFYRARGLDLQIAQANQGIQWVSIRNFMFNERNMWNFLYNPIAISILGGTNILYRVQGQTIRLIPTPNIANLNFRLWFIPTYTALVSDSDTLDGVDGWEEYVIVDVCIKMMAKQECDTTAWDTAKAALINRINQGAANRDVGNPQRVADTVQGTSQGPFQAGGLPF